MLTQMLHDTITRVSVQDWTRKVHTSDSHLVSASEDFWPNKCVLILEASSLWEDALFPRPRLSRPTVLRAIPVNAWFRKSPKEYSVSKELKDHHHGHGLLRADCLLAHFSRHSTTLVANSDSLYVGPRGKRGHTSSRRIRMLLPGRNSTSLPGSNRLQHAPSGLQHPSTAEQRS